jgi:hypothetical protein
MANVKVAYGTEAQAITITLASLAQAAARESSVIDNTTNLFLDALVMLRVKTGAGTPANQKAINVYVAGTVDSATPLWPDAVAGAGDAAITMDNPTNLKLLGVVQAFTTAHTFEGGPWSVAACFGGTMPEKWLIVVENQEGIALDATEGNHLKRYQGVYATVT